MGSSYISCQYHLQFPINHNSNSIVPTKADVTSVMIEQHAKVYRSVMFRIILTGVISVHQDEYLIRLSFAVKESEINFAKAFISAYAGFNNFVNPLGTESSITHLRGVYDLL